VESPDDLENAVKPESRVSISIQSKPDALQPHIARPRLIHLSNEGSHRRTAPASSKRLRFDKPGGPMLKIRPRS
jgi:hypothetical protein